MADSILQALAQTLAAANLPGVGHVFDQMDTDPTPDAITARVDGLAQILFLDPHETLYDTNNRGGRMPTFGLGGQETDEHTVLILVMIGPMQPTQVGTLQRKARPFVRALIHDCVRAHNTLGGVVWRANCPRAKAGQIEWGGVPWYAAQITAVLADDRSVVSGN